MEEGGKRLIVKVDAGSLPPVFGLGDGPRPDASAARDADASPAPPNQPDAADGQRAAGDSSNAPPSPPKNGTDQPARGSSPKKAVRFEDNAGGGGKSSEVEGPGVATIVI